MQATSVSGSRPSACCICSRVSLPMIGLEVAHHGRIGSGPRGRADDVVGVAHIGDPVAQRLVHGVLQRPRAGSDGVDLGAQQLHAEHVGLLPLDVDGAHEDLARQVWNLAHTVATATPCWPAPVSAMMRVLPMRLASRIWPRQLLILWLPVWLSSSRLK